MVSNKSGVEPSLRSTLGSGKSLVFLFLARDRALTVEKRDRAATTPLLLEPRDGSKRAGLEARERVVRRVESVTAQRAGGINTKKDMQRRVSHDFQKFTDKVIFSNLLI